MEVVFKSSQVLHLSVNERAKQLPSFFRKYLNHKNRIFRTHPHTHTHTIFVNIFPLTVGINQTVRLFVMPVIFFFTRRLFV